MNELYEVFPFIKQAKHDFEYQHKLLKKVTLTGKINSDVHTNNLFEFADKTGENFSELKDELLHLLLEENLKNRTNVLNSKAGTTINVLIRNLFERTADVGFLATDSVIVDFLSSDSISKESLIQRLDEYVQKYSVYNEVLIFDTQGNVKANLNANNRLDSSTDAIIQETLQADDYVERYAYTDIFKSQKKTLTFTQKIKSQGQTLGVLCLCFKFDDELERIFTELDSTDDVVLLVEKNNVIASNKVSSYNVHSHFRTSENEYDVTNKVLSVCARSSGYQGYKGLDWVSASISKNSASSSDMEAGLSHSFISSDIQAIIDNADNIVDDLGDIIINGELIAAKKRIYVLNPILDSLRIISSNLLDTLKNSVDNIEQLMQQSLKFNFLSSTKLAIDIMDRNLYERANDSRWWALTPLFMQELQKEVPNEKELNNVLLYINELYTVYTNIFIYDKDAKVVASSNDQSIIGKVLRGSEISKTLQNNDSQKYFVSAFEQTDLYNNEATYIYHASINESSRCIGGIGVVFDSRVEFQAILEDCFTQGAHGIFLFIDKDGMIISSTDTNMPVLSKVPLENKVLEPILREENYYDMITLEGEKYVVASSVSKGYREYKVDDNYTNKIIALRLFKI